MTTQPPSSDDTSLKQAGPHAAVTRVVFGKRLQSPEHEVSFRREKLRILGAELNLLFAYRIEAETCFAELHEGDLQRQDEPILVLGQSIGLLLTVEIEAGSGLFVLYEQAPLSGGRSASHVLITAGEERLIDQIVGIVSAESGELAPRTADAATDILVGRTLAEVERRLVLRTLFRFHGDRKQAAFALGIDEAMLRAKLRRYFIDKWRGLTAGEEPQ